MLAWFDHLGCATPTGGWEKIMIIAWTIWFARNKLVHEGVKLHTPSILWQAEQAVRDAKMAAAPKAARADLHWLPPPAGWSKMNTDATINNQGTVGIAAIIREAGGRVMAAMAKRTSVQMDIFGAECLAIREGLRLLRRHSSQHMIIESDALNAVNAIRAGTYLRSAAGDHIIKTREYLTELSNFEINHCYRECNKAAHALAKQALTTDSIAIWVGCCPTTLTGLL